MIYWLFSVNTFAIVRYIGNTSYANDSVLPRLNSLSELLVYSCFGGLLFGVFSGFIQVLIYPRYIRKVSFGLNILLRSVIFVLLATVIILLVSFIIRMRGIGSSSSIESIFQYLLSPSFLAITLYVIVTSSFLDLVIQINRRMGPGSLRSLITGKYFHPQEEKRIFMFLDLTSSTTIAEQLGHVQFSSLLQDCYHRLSRVLLKYEASVYQYVGDEVVLTWEYDRGLSNFNCFRLFFEFDKLIAKNDYYLKKYGIQPKFKASINAGNVTVAEVGDIKSELAFHGDVLNTGARVQKLCKIYGEDVLVCHLSEDFESEDFSMQKMDSVRLEGRKSPVDVYALRMNKKDVVSI